MKRQPVNLNFLTLHFPITAWVSIAHRLSGIGLFLFTPILLWALQTSLASKEDFMALSLLVRSTLIVQVGVWVLLAALLYHFVAGIRHLLLDVHLGDSKIGGRRGAQWVMVMSVVFTALAGYWLW